MKNYLITEIPHNTKNAGYKAKVDIKNILTQEGFEAIDIKERFSFDKIPEFFSFLKKLKGIENGSNVFLQSPVYSFFNSKFMPMIFSIIKRKKLRLFVIIHDIESVRFAKDDYTKKLEAKLFNMAERVIAHNPSMISFLEREFNVDGNKIISLGIFDYISNKNAKRAGDYKSVLVAGNLSSEKSSYIYKLGSVVNRVKINLFGGGYDVKLASEKILYRGSFEPDDLVGELKAGFGIIWDGDSLECCSGVTGEYLKINNPHKTSLYLSSGLPVIIWDKAALAPFIVQNGYGIAVSSLSEIEEKIAPMSKKDYYNMKLNVLTISSKLKNGEFIKKAVAECLK